MCCMILWGPGGWCAASRQKRVVNHDLQVPKSTGMLLRAII